MVVRLGRTERKAQTRDEILGAALRVFLRAGFHGASLDAIAEDAGYTKGAVYSNFGGKDDLFLALLDEQFAVRLAAFRRAVSEARSFEEALRANGRLMAETARAQPGWTPLLIEFWTHASRQPALRTEAAARHDRVLDAVGEVIHELGRRYGAEWDREPREVVRAAAAFARGMALERLLDPSAVSVARFEEEFVMMVGAHLRSARQEGAHR
jgi:AcrR family transcriptional regulator